MSTPRRPVVGFVLSLISGIFIILNAALLSLAHVLTLFYFAMRHPPWMWGGLLVTPTWFPLFLTVFGVICGLAVLMGAYRLLKGKNVSGGVLIILFSVLSLLIGGGFVVGFMLGVVGGALSLVGV